ncbi:MAG: helicase, superfamily [Actinomycetia bacterium]|nr:helicase, superfamily [Actinomycetes bacterium]
MALVIRPRLEYATTTGVGRSLDSDVTTFAELGVSSELVKALSEQGIDEPFPIQALTIADGLAGRDVCGKAKTGSGKTLAFGLAILDRVVRAESRKPRGLVLVPTRELAVQVDGVLAPLGKVVDRRVRACYGGVPIDPQVNALRRGVDVVIGTPGRCIDLMERGDLDVSDVGIVVLDEADRMLDMGFLPQVQKLLYRIRGEHQTMLFSATLDGAVNSLVRTYLNDPVRHEVHSREITVAEMEHRFFLVHQMDKVRVAAAIASHADRTLIFVRTKRGADKLVGDLKQLGVKVAAIHGDLRQKAREQGLADFTSGALPVLVATDVAARGIDVEGVDVVIHYDPPDDHKAYLHRSGRTARAGRRGVVVTLSLWDQENLIRLLMRRIGITQPIVEVFSNDERLADVVAWNPAADAAAS